MDTETQFLDTIAQQLGINGKVRQVFLVCFRRRNRDVQETDLPKQIWEPGEITTPLETMCQHLSKIYPLLEKKLNCPAFPQGNGRGRPRGDERKLSHYSSWLWDVKYPEDRQQQSQLLTSPHRHPFGDRGRIEDPDRFFGRGEFLRRLQEDLSHGTSISLVGNPQIGKSSILRYLYQRGNHEWRGNRSEFVYIDMQLINQDEDFYAVLCEELRIDYPCRPYQLSRQLERRGNKYVLLIDEVEVLGGENFSFDIRYNLRGLADGDRQPFILVIASRSPLEIIFPDLPDRASPLADFCQHRDVLPFTKAETIEFIKHRLMGTGVDFSDEQIAELYAHTQGHPGRLQQAAKDVFDRMQPLRLP